MLLGFWDFLLNSSENACYRCQKELHRVQAKSSLKMSILQLSRLHRTLTCPCLYLSFTKHGLTVHKHAKFVIFPQTQHRMVKTTTVFRTLLPSHGRVYPMFLHSKTLDAPVLAHMVCFLISAQLYMFYSWIWGTQLVLKT